jgi:hypothetical protein
VTGEGFLRILKPSRSFVRAEDDQDIGQLGASVLAGEGEALSPVRDLLARMDGDTARLWELLGVDAD